MEWGCCRATDPAPIHKSPIKSFRSLEPTRLSLKALVQRYSFKYLVPQSPWNCNHSLQILPWHSRRLYSMSQPLFREGTINFTYDGETYQTYYKLFGDLIGRTRDPIVVLHGGPGLVHDYLFPFANLATQHNFPVILYDQIGNGRSSHIKGKDPAFWTIDLFIDRSSHIKGKEPAFWTVIYSSTNSSISSPTFLFKTASILWDIPGVESLPLSSRFADSRPD